MRTDFDDEFGHGTCMADLAVGKLNGVAREADLTAVRIDNLSNNFLYELSLELNVDSLSVIVDDIEAKNLGDKSVVLMAFKVPTTGEPARNRAFDEAYFALLLELEKRGVSLVVAVPNDEKCNYWPCSAGNPDDKYYLPNLVTVGEGSIDDGSYGSYEEDRDDWVTVYGPGDDRSGGDDQTPGFLCAAPEGNENSDVGQGGTSHASAVVAGLLACYKRLGLGGVAAKKELLKNRYRRNPEGPLMPWNGCQG